MQVLERILQKIEEAKKEPLFRLVDSGGGAVAQIWS